MKKLKLNELKVKSFITDMDKNLNSVRGGDLFDPGNGGGGGSAVGCTVVAPACSSPYNCITGP